MICIMDPWLMDWILTDNTLKILTYLFLMSLLWLSMSVVVKFTVILSIIVVIHICICHCWHDIGCSESVPVIHSLELVCNSWFLYEIIFRVIFPNRWSKFMPFLLHYPFLSADCIEHIFTFLSTALSLIHAIPRTQMPCILFLYNRGLILEKTYFILLWCVCIKLLGSWRSPWCLRHACKLVRLELLWRLLCQFISICFQ